MPGVLARLHASQVPLQSLSQQTPSLQWPDKHSVALPQDAPNMPVLGPMSEVPISSVGTWPLR